MELIRVSNNTAMIFLQLAILLICIFIGARMSGIGLGVMGMIGLLILMFVFHVQPSDPPLEVMLIIMSVVTAAAALQAAGGMDYLVKVAGKILRSHPGQITILGPLVTYCFTLFAGTAHISYSILPIIAEVAIKARIRPERALSMSVTAAHMGITASPVSAATAALLTVLGSSGIKLADILLICIPATVIGVIVGIIFVYKRGKELDKDPEFLERMKDPAFAKNLDTEVKGEIALKPGAIPSLIIFGVAVLSIVLLGSFPGLLPNFAAKEGFAPNFAVSASGQVQMPAMIMMIMLGATGLIILFAKTTAGQVTKASLFSSAASATIAVFGVVWMSSSFMDHNFVAIKDTLGEMVNKYPWLFALALFTLSILLFSQAATTKALMPLGLVLGLSPAFLLGIFPAVNGHFFIPGYPTLLTAIQFDRTGTTRIGKYVLNHSFMLPGLVTTAAAVGAGLILQLILL
jgi:anaerobic C4-dicarboxylate transporter DcuA